MLRSQFPSLRDELVQFTENVAPPVHMSQVEFPRQFLGFKKDQTVDEAFREGPNTFSALLHDRHDLLHKFLVDTYFSDAPFDRHMKLDDWAKTLGLRPNPDFKRFVGDHDLLNKTPDIMTKSWMPDYDFVLLDPTISRKFMGASLGKRAAYDVVRDAYLDRFYIAGFVVLEETMNVREELARHNLPIPDANRLNLLERDLMSYNKLVEAAIDSTSVPKYTRIRYHASRVNRTDLNFADPGLDFTPDTAFQSEFFQSCFSSQADLSDACLGKGRFADEAQPDLTENDQEFLNGLYEQVYERLDSEIPNFSHVLSILHNTDPNSTPSEGDHRVLSDMVGAWLSSKNDNPKILKQKCIDRSKVWEDAVVDDNKRKRLIPLPFILHDNSQGLQEDTLDFHDLLNRRLLVFLTCEQSPAGDWLHICHQAAKEWVHMYKVGDEDEAHFLLHDSWPDLKENALVSQKRIQMRKQMKDRGYNITGKNSVRVLSKKEDLLSFGIGAKSHKRQNSLINDQWRKPHSYSLEADTSEVLRLSRYLAEQHDTGTISSIAPFYRVTMSDYCADHEIEMCREANNVTRPLRSSKSYHYMMFLSSLYKQLAIMANRPIGDGEVNIGTLEHYNVLIFLMSGQSSSSTTCKRLFKLIFAEHDITSLKFCGKTFSIGSGLSMTEWEYYTPWHTAHYARGHDVMEALTASYISEHLAPGRLSRDLPQIDPNTHAYCAGYVPMLYLNAKHGTFRLHQNGRYILMSASSLYADMEEMFVDKQLKLPLRSLVQVYIINAQIDFYVRFKGSSEVQSWAESVHRVLLDGVEDDLSSVGARIAIPRMTWPGTHASVKNALSEIYLCNLETLEGTSQMHAKLAAFKKLAKVNSLYDLASNDSRSRVLGYDPHDPSINGDLKLTKLLLSGKQLPCSMSRRAISVGCKLSGFQTKSGKIMSNFSMTDQTRLLDSRSKTTSAVRDRVLRIEAEYLQAIKDLRDTSDASSKLLYKILKAVKSEVRGKVIENLIEEATRQIEAGQNLTVCQLAGRFIQSTTTVFNDIADKLQIGAVRELMIQDMLSSFGSHYVESLSESVNKEDEYETLTDKAKFHTQVRNERQLLSRTHRTYADCADSEEWGPRFVPAANFQPLMNALRVCFGDNLINGANMQLCKMSWKQIEIPRAVWQPWFHRGFDPERLKPDIRQLYDRCMATGELVFLNKNNMGQGILHETSSLCHTSQFHLEDEIERRLFGHQVGILYNRRKMCGSDDNTKYNSVMKGVAGVATLIILLEVDECCRRLVNIKRSLPKSNVGAIFHEFNSNFCINGSSEGVESKFLIVASKLPVLTDYEGTLRGCMSLIRAAQFRGATASVTTLMIHRATQFLESIFQNANGKRNDPSKTLLLSAELVPIQLFGHLRITALELFSCGPDIVNYLNWTLADKSPSPSLLRQCIGWVYYPGSPIEEFEGQQTLKDEVKQDLQNTNILCRKIRMYIRVDDKIKKARGRLRITKEEIESFFEARPFLAFLPAIDAREALFKLCATMYSRGLERAYAQFTRASDFSKVIASATGAIYTCFDIGSKDAMTEDRKTVTQCLEHIRGEMVLSKVSRYNNIIGQLISGFMKRYEEFREWSDSMSLGPIWVKHSFRTTLRSTEMRSAGIKLINPATHLLFSKWDPTSFSQRGMVLSNPMRADADWNRLKSAFPFLEDTLQETVKSMGLSHDDKGNSRVVAACLHSLISNSSKVMDHYRCGPKEAFMISSWTNYAQYNAITGMHPVGNRITHTDYLPAEPQEVGDHNDFVANFNLTEAIRMASSQFAYAFTFSRLGQERNEDGTPTRLPANKFVDLAKVNTITLSGPTVSPRTVSTYDLFSQVSSRDIMSLKMPFQIKRLALLARAYCTGQVSELLSWFASSNNFRVEYVKDFPKKNLRGMETYDRDAPADVKIRSDRLSIRCIRLLRDELPQINLRGTFEQLKQIKQVTRIIKAAALIFGYYNTTSLISVEELEDPKDWVRRITPEQDSYNLAKDRSHRPLVAVWKEGQGFFVQRMPDTGMILRNITITTGEPISLSFPWGFSSSDFAFDLTEDHISLKATSFMGGETTTLLSSRVLVDVSKCTRSKFSNLYSDSLKWRGLPMDLLWNMGVLSTEGCSQEVATGFLDEIDYNDVPQLTSLLMRKVQTVTNEVLASMKTSYSFELSPTAAALFTQSEMELDMAPVYGMEEPESEPQELELFTDAEYANAIIAEADVEVLYEDEYLPQHSDASSSLALGLHDMSDQESISNLAVEVEPVAGTVEADAIAAAEQSLLALPSWETASVSSTTVSSRKELSVGGVSISMLLKALLSIVSASLGSSYVDVHTRLKFSEWFACASWLYVNQQIDNKLQFAQFVVAYVRLLKGIGEPDNLDWVRTERTINGREVKLTKTQSEAINNAVIEGELPSACLIKYAL